MMSENFRYAILIEDSNSTTDLAIRIVDELVVAGFIKDCTDTDDEDEFECQDIIHEILTNEISVIKDKQNNIN